MTAGKRYVLAKKIARGGMAEIYLGKHVGEDGFQRLCAIKRILPHYANDQEFIQMFRDEAHICKRLQHANIVRVEGFEEVEGSYAIIMEYVAGADLRSLLHAGANSKRRVQIPMACHIIAEAARGLHYAHVKTDEITQQALGIVHRDISPQNILVSFEGEVKVTDFGIADADSKLTETRPGVVKGKYSYMSPEQISAKPVDARTDVFALSIVLWEMIAMKRLFQGQNEVDTIQKVRSCRIDHDIRQLNNEVDENLERILKQGLARDAKKRFASAGELEKALRRYMSHRYPDFTPEDLGSFLKSVLGKKLEESTLDIKRTLTETNLKPNRVVRKRSQSSIAFTAEDDKASSGFNVIKPSQTDTVSKAQSLFVSQTPISQQSKLRSQFHSAAKASHISRMATSHSKDKVGFVSKEAHAVDAKAFKARKRRGRFWLLASLATASLCVALFLAGKFSAVGEPAEVVLRSQPSRVRLSLNGQFLAEGRYLRASSRHPLRFKVASGNHVLKIHRQGYHSAKYEFSATGGDRIVKDDIVLKERSELGAIKIRAKSLSKPIRFDIDEGYYLGSLVPGRIKALAPDLLYGRTYGMQVYYGNKSDQGFTCRFKVRSKSWRRPNEIVIDVRSRSCSMRGP